MSDQLIVEHCSPTLAGIKTANLFSVKLDDEKDLKGELRRLNKRLKSKGLRAIPVKHTDKYALIYLFRPDRLEKDLNSPLACDILRKKGYACGNTKRCIVQLIRHLSKDAAFPHEIGLFLGYPPSDVREFMKHPSSGVKCSGCWKAYGDEKKAKAAFDRYKSCTESYSRALRCGASLYQLAVRRAAV